MKRSRTALNEAIETLIAHPATIPTGHDRAQIDLDYIRRLNVVLHEAILLSCEPDYKGRHPIYWSIRSSDTHYNPNGDSPVLRLGEDATVDEQDRALMAAADNVRDAAGKLAEVARDQRYRREVKELDQS